MGETVDKAVIILEDSVATLDKASADVLVWY